MNFGSSGPHDLAPLVLPARRGSGPVGDFDGFREPSYKTSEKSGLDSGREQSGLSLSHRRIKTCLRIDAWPGVPRLFCAIGTSGIIVKVNQRAGPNKREGFLIGAGGWGAKR